MRRAARCFQWHVAAAAVVVFLVFPGAVRSQPPSYSYAYLRAQCQSGTLRIVLTAYDRSEHPEIIGFHVYRRTLGVCNSQVRVTTAPLVRAAGTDYTLTVEDASAPATQAHEYHLAAVDVNGVERDAYTLFSPLDSSLFMIASCASSPPIASGLVEDWGWALAVMPCPASCFDWVLLDEFPVELRALAGTGTPVLVHGWFVCGTVEGCLGRVTTFTTTSCQVAVQEQTWSGFKRLYQ